MNTLFLHLILVLSLLQTLSGCSQPTTSDLNVIGGVRTNVMESLVRFIDPTTNKTACGSGVVVHPNVVLTAGHCLDLQNAKGGFKRLQIAGISPVAAYSFADLDPQIQTLYDGGKNDIGVLVYNKDLVTELNIKRIVHITPLYPATGDAIAVVGVGVSNLDDRESKITIGDKRFGVNSIDSFSESRIHFDATRMPTELGKNVGLAVGDSGAAILNAQYELLGIGSFYDNPEDVLAESYDNYVVDLTSAPVKEVFKRAMNCKVDQGEICAPWFSESGENSKFKLGIAVQPKLIKSPYETVTEQELYDAIFELGEKGTGPFSTKPQLGAEVFVVHSGSTAETVRLRKGGYISDITNAIDVNTSADLAIYADLTGSLAEKSKGMESFVKVGYFDPESDLQQTKFIETMKLKPSELIHRNPLSIALGVPKTRAEKEQALIPGNYRVGLGYETIPLNSVSSYRAFKVNKIYDGPARNADVRLGDIITEINYRWILKPADWTRAYEQSVDGKARIVFKRTNEIGAETTVIKFIEVKPKEEFHN